ncbi:MAG: hypothetical protein ACXAEU_11775 [Candidatus Hodarchaeales archaeon]|jgi:membrane-bound metal-dependent hydrolase YbcI (DUF457 family)
MPFTPFHFGIGLFLFAIFPFLDPLALLVGVIIPDIEGIASLFIFRGLGLPLHGPLHSFLAAIPLGLVVGCISYFFINNIMIVTFPNFKISLKASLMSGLLGTLSHIILDAPLYSEMNPLLPLTGNVFYRIFPTTIPYLICIIGFLAGILILMIRVTWITMIKNRNNKDS